MLEDSIEIEIIAIKGEICHKMIMTLLNWKSFKRNRNYVYKAYQLGFSQYKLENDNKDKGEKV